MTSEQVQAVVKDYSTAGLDPIDVAICNFAAKVTLHAYKVTPEDVLALRAHGLSDAEVFDIAIAAGFRAMYSKVLDAVGAEPDPEYSQLDPDLLNSLIVGRPFPGPSLDAKSPHAA
jgi:alkylhydroperoxidase family enzyme